MTVRIFPFARKAGSNRDSFEPGALANAVTPNFPIRAQCALQQSGREEIDRLGGGDGLDVTCFEAEHPYALHQFLLHVAVAQLA